MDAFLDVLKGDGTTDSEGHFTLNKAQLQERYGRFQQERHLYHLIRIVQGIHQMEPSKIQAKLSNKSLTLRALDLPQSHSVQPVGCWFDGVSALSQGLLTCFMKSFDRVELQGCDGTLSACKNGALKFQPRQGEASAFELRLHLGKPSGFWHFLFGGALDRVRIHGLLSDSCASSGIPIFLDGRLVNRHQYSPSASPLIEWQVEDPGLRPARAVWSEADSEIPRSSAFLRVDENGEVLGPDSPPAPTRAKLAIRSDLMRHSLIHFVDYGVNIKTLSLEIDCPGLVAYCSAVHLDMDASGLGIVKNDTYERELCWIREQACRAFQAFENHRLSGTSVKACLEQDYHLARESYAVKASEKLTAP